MLPLTARFFALTSALVKEKPFLKVKSMFYPKSCDSWFSLKSKMRDNDSSSLPFKTSGKTPVERICSPHRYASSTFLSMTGTTFTIPSKVDSVFFCVCGFARLANLLVLELSTNLRSPKKALRTSFLWQ